MSNMEHRVLTAARSELDRKHHEEARAMIQLEFDPVSWTHPEASHAVVPFGDAALILALAEASTKMGR